MLFFTALLSICTYRVHAQRAAIQGIVTDRVSGRPLEGANVALREISGATGRGTATDREGYYRIGGLSPGRYELLVSYVGYEAERDTVVLEAGGPAILAVTLRPTNERLGELLVAQQGGTGRIEGGVQRIRQVDLQRVPTPAGGGDLASYLQSLPSVVSAGDRGGQLFVRGGDSSHNLVLVDGAVVHRPFHIVGFFSPFPEDLISGVDFYAGGFGARYQGRISSVLDIRMRDGNREQAAAAVTLSPLRGGIRIEGPLKKGSTSLITSLQSSLIERTSLGLLGERQPLNFASQYVKLSTWGSNSRCSVMGMHTYDRGRLDPALENSDRFRWTNTVLNGRCLVVPEQSQGLFEVNAGLSHLGNSAGNPDRPERKAGITRFHIDLNLTSFRENIRFDLGVFTRLQWFKYDLQEQYLIARREDGMMLGAGSYLDAIVPLGGQAEIEPGVVFTLYPWVYKPSLEPRLRFRWRPRGSGESELNAALGLYKQAMIGISDDRDAGSPFTAWLPEPFEGAATQMQAFHSLLGWHQRFNGGIGYSVEGYYKRLNDLPVSIWSAIARFTTELTRADGDVFGADTRLEYRGDGLYLVLGYGYSWTQYRSAQQNFGFWFGEPVQRYHPLHDRRHKVNALVSLRIGSFDASLQWQFGSGLPFTRHMGFDELINLEMLPDVRDLLGTRRILLEKPYRGRLPTFHRLDLSVERTFTLPLVELVLQGGVINLYDRANLFYYDLYTQRRIDQLPLLPYLSLKLETR